ncbi:bifunctional [glutamine synthetase] adenylyltransferase/[glutamine synthetase]-adenylyl-L-tyrosine phosphorylase [Methylobrevis albus]|uniref:Bifunctional glutamine synthetase adenylyltransferase/adenylyl-removing enzyme n=1 Tax=Methylobrevis albus TaxID=2793297 RepID=A0A931HZZ5_9HYPH|nr:bifunctional [glutamine synthetase] adenylyltransferase/[glutamine synthetase]-adenylyl-L-tyrosine phosphorylase [Methylobrevis albus]MBH0237585.1 bifunctional [glutamine synthetase] adenylyltransferase/[glutamine synthetase]-adenylyl-L-tyrosine phosphorylase [Methylobrevis albus]
MSADAEATPRGAAALAARIRDVPPFGPDRAAAESDLADVLAVAAPEAAALADLLVAVPAARDLLVSTMANAPFLRDLMRGRPERVLACLTEAPEARMAALVGRLGDEVPPTEAEAMRLLRQVKQEAALLIALADLGGVWSLFEVTGALTRLADASVSAAIRFLLREAAAQGKFLPPDPADPEAGSGLIVLAMGKHGAFELNYSSDVDLIVFYDAEVAPVAPGVEPATFFVRLVRRMVRILQDRTADGYSFRTDLRLRPDPGATAMAISVAAAFVYYESIGQNWERAALIKARPCAGDIVAGDRFLREIGPFIWRKYLDYASIRDIHSIKRQIHAHKGHGRIAVAGHNIKLGRGGIREIEFFVQTQQLIAGGRNIELRGRETVPMLSALVDLGWLQPQVRDELVEAYVFLRTVEHRIQMVNDEQTHRLPETPAGLDRIARLSGFGDGTSFGAALTKRLTLVTGHYGELFDQEASLAIDGGNMVFTGDEDDPGTIETLRGLGFSRPEEVTRAIRAWHFGRYPATRSTKTREILTEITPRLLDAFARTDAADQAFNAFDTFLSRLPTGVQLFSLLSANPNLLDLVATIMGTAPRLAQVVARRAHVMDAVLEPAFFGAVPDEEEIARHLDETLAQARSFEEALDRARIFAHEQQFLIGVRILSGTLSARRAGDAFARLADALLRAVLGRVVAVFEGNHGKVPGGRMALLALGKLGGREMTATSDLDLILLYDYDREAAASDGPKPLAPSQYFARLTQRLVTALSAPTAEGKLYDVDFRLRPSGNSGPLATRIDAFARYQREDAWTWEHMALTRARVVAGPEDFAAEIEAVLAETLTRPRDRAATLLDIADMRARVETDRPAKDIWDLKLAPGGLFDVEFVAQALELLHGHDHPEILSTSTEAALRAAAEAGVLEAVDADVLIPALTLYSDLTQLIRLAIEGNFKVADAPRGFLDLVVRAGEMPSIATLEAHLAATQAAVRGVFEKVVGKVARKPEAEPKPPGEAPQGA